MSAWLNARNLQVAPTCAALEAHQSALQAQQALENGNASDGDSSGTSAGVIAGACAAVALGLVALFALARVVLRRRHKQAAGKKTVQMVPPVQSCNSNKKPTFSSFGSIGGV